MQSNNNPYSNQNNSYNSSNKWEQDNSLNQQRKLNEERREQQYLFTAEQALDKVAEKYLSAQRNSLELEINQEDKAPIIRYYKRYRDNKFIASSLVTALITYAISFYTPFAIVGIFTVFLLREYYSQLMYMTYLLNDHDLSRFEILELKNKIFYKQLKTSTSLIITFILMVSSYMSVFVSKSLFFVDFFETKKGEFILNFLSKLTPFHPEMELFAYSNILAI